MSKINIIQNAIKELEGGSFQKLFDEYLYRKYKLKNIQTLGVQEGTNKTTKGTPDSFVTDENGKYILIMYGTVETGGYSKIKQDIYSCFNKDKLQLEESKISKIICAYSSTNIHVDQLEELRNIIEGVEIITIGLSTISYDLLVNYPFLAAEYLNIPIDTQQIYSREDFIQVYDKNGMNAPLDMDFYYRADEKQELHTLINTSQITLITGRAGVGKTRLVLEVCKQFEKQGWNIVCVKNNGQLLYNDIRYYISDEGKYVLFIDDANQTTSLESILDYIIGLSDNTIVKLVMTVRDYAGYRVKEVICRYVFPAELNIDVLKEDEIKEILKRNLKILNGEYLDRIAKIAKGNARLAILAGKIAIENGYLAIRNATDIFANYYGKIMEGTELTGEFVNALFVIALLGTIKFKENILAQKILELVGINTEYFIHLCYELNEKELIDLYQDEVAKVSDQSLGNYIIEYVLIEKKIISISQLLKIGFPQFKNKLVFALNTLTELFYSKELEKYIVDQVNISWDLAEENQQDEYLKCFHRLNQEKCLAILKQRVDGMDRVEMDLIVFDIESKKNYNNIEHDEVSILSAFKYSEYYEDAIELMLMFYNKRPDLVMDFYVAFVHNMSYDIYSYELNYEKEHKLIECLWRNADDGKNVNITILLIHILKEMLKCKFHKAEWEHNRNVNMYTFQLVYTDGIKKIRLFIWEILSVLYSNDIYKNLVSEIISAFHVHGLDGEEAKKFFKCDLICVKELFFDKWEVLSFEQCKILKQLEQNAECLEMENAEIFQRYTENKDFIIYNTLTQEHVKGRSWEEDEREHKKCIGDMIREYKKNDYIHLFEICKMCEEKDDREDWSIKSALDIIFMSIEDDSKLFYDIAKLYLKHKAPYGYNPREIISVLINQNGLENTKKLIEENVFPYKHIWLCIFWEIAPQELLNEEYINKFLEFMQEESVMDKPYFPKVFCLNKYKTYDPMIVKKVSDIIIDCSQEKEYLVAEFLGGFNVGSKIDLLKKLFVDDWILLEKLYLIAFGNHFDNSGELLIELIKKNFSFWNDFTLRLVGNIHRTSYEHNIFECVWGLDDYNNFIQIAYKNMLESYYAFRVNDEGIVIFANGEKTTECIRKRKKQWIKEFIVQNHDNIDNIKMIFHIIATVFPSDKIEFLAVFTQYNKDLVCFKDIPLFPTFDSWTGSEIPLIDKKISFLSDLISELKGVDFIEHRAYLKEKKSSFERYRQSVLIQEYLSNEDIA